MLPAFLSPNGGVAGTSVQVPPPPGFRRIEGEISWTTLGSVGSRSPQGRTAAQKAGGRYEKRILCALQERFKDLFFPQQELRWQDQRGEARCFMDGLLLLGKTIIPIEVKSQHMPESWWQLCKYRDILSAWPGRDGRSILRLEICRSLDAAMPYPEAYVTVESIDDFIIQSTNCSLGVLQWRL